MILSQKLSYQAWKGFPTGKPLRPPDSSGGSLTCASRQLEESCRPWASARRVPKGLVDLSNRLKHFLAPEGGFDYAPRLIRQETGFRPYQLEVGHAKVTLRKSPYDSPWSRVEVVRLLGALYTRGNNTMHPGRVIAEVNPKAVEPFAGLKYDW